MFKLINDWFGKTGIAMYRHRKKKWLEAKSRDAGMAMILDALSDEDFKKSVVVRMRRRFEVPNFEKEEEDRAYRVMVTELSKEIIIRYATTL